MASNKAPNHFHKYKKVNLSRNPEKKPYFVYKCVKPLCNHYIRLDLAEGKMCECNRCGEPMVITKATLHGSSNTPMTKPHCNNCIERKENQDVAAIADFLAGNKV